MVDVIYGTVQKNGTRTCLARVVDDAAADIDQTTIAAATYSVFLLDDNDPDERIAVAGHEDVPLNVADVVFNSMQTDDRWTADATGYNFRHTIDVSANAAFTIAKRNYLVEYLLTPVSGQVIVLQFRLLCV